MYGLTILKSMAHLSLIKANKRSASNSNSNGSRWFNCCFNCSKGRRTTIGRFSPQAETRDAKSGASGGHFDKVFSPCKDLQRLGIIFNIVLLYGVARTFK